MAGGCLDDRGAPSGSNEAYMPNETTTIRLVTCTDRLEPCTGHAGLLFECAPDSPILNNYPNRLDLRALIGDFDEAKLSAYQLTRKLLRDEPVFRGIRQLGILEEPLTAFSRLLNRCILR